MDSDSDTLCYYPDFPDVLYYYPPLVREDGIIVLGQLREDTFLVKLPTGEVLYASGGHDSSTVPSPKI